MNTAEHETLVELLADAGARFVATVVGLPPEAWDRPALGEWNVRELVGHTLRAFETIDRFLDHPCDRIDAADAAQYYREALAAGPEVHAVVAQRGRDAGEALGDDPAVAVVERVSATMGRLGGATGEEVGLTAVGGMRLTDYLETRLVELVVHYSDLCAAVGVEVGDLGAAGVQAAATVFGSAAPADRDRVMRAMLGRGGLPAGFSVWP